MKLHDYRRKRDFRQTGEPRGGAKARRDSRVYVMHKHHARRLHYDLRLEWNGVLKSWAVPKGPSLDPAVRVLAVQVEDHPLEYGRFEGTIPEGQYGAGKVVLWDRGRWTPEGDVEAGLRRGRLEFELKGEKLHGAWRLVRMRDAGNGKGVNWLLMKRHDEYAVAHDEYDVLEALPDGVVKSARAGHRRKQPFASKSSSPRRSAARVPVSRESEGSALRMSDRLMKTMSSARPAALPSKLSPQLATLVDSPPDGNEWLHETKFDGYRLIAIRDGDRVKLWTRNGHDWTNKLQHIGDVVRRLPVRQAVLDGEVIVPGAGGASDFQALQNALHGAGASEVIYMLFDIPYCNGMGLAGCPLLERKELLSALLDGRSDRETLRFSDHVVGKGAALFKQACRKGLEGIVSKRMDSRYESRRTRTWVKCKCASADEFVVAGFTRPQGARRGIGALILGEYDAHGKLSYRGRVGTGFSESTLTDLHDRLRALIRSDSPFTEPLPAGAARQVQWVAPHLVAEVRYQERTRDGVVRHAVFKGLRMDKSPRDTVQEPARKGHSNGRRTHRSVSRASGPSVRRSSSAMPSPSPRGNETRILAGVGLTHPKRVVFPAAHVTKLGLAKYYEAVSKLMLPHIIGRPLMLLRCPEGAGKPCFFQKHPLENMPDMIRAARIRGERGSGQYLVIDDLPGLIALVQMNALEIHPWACRMEDLERPDRLIFDLDPGPGTTWETVVDAAFRVRDELAGQGLASFVKTSGSKGLHVIAPLRPHATWAESKAFARAIAFRLAEDQPDRFTRKMTKATRPGRIYVDYLRNSRGATCVAPYSTRANAAGPVSAPVAWNALRRLHDAGGFTVLDMPRRMSRSAAQWPRFFELDQVVPSQQRRR